ncbi:hypothetical protein [Ahrensia sp. R2A130]|uniref:hypothetical protein n=1 Tax=Ahrensia sp. R2A130 TaxID=744979 RepID=UPI0001E0D14B|nr:hypothetical protein [Ahrensia sp. R2A130]EFL87676.1 helix-turn-helix type 11 domain-containing protein [Ahrensia sp. R2A130]
MRSSPVNFDGDEAEAIAVGLNMIARTGDPKLWQAARRASSKLQTIAARTCKLIASSLGAKNIPAVDLSKLRLVIRQEQKMKLTYADVKER